MTIATKQLEDIFEELQSNFPDNGSVHIEPLDGSPPEKYTITYDHKGIHKDPSGDIVTSNTHAIIVSIPFGYPHFPPSCAPKSPVFHPDFDPDAICIGEFWDEGKSLSDLIVFIGQMIAGEFYSTENAFNEEAANWYKEHDQELPFDTFEIISPSEPSETSNIGELEDQTDDLELDIIADTDLDDKHSYLTVDKPDELNLDDEHEIFDDLPEEDDDIDIDFFLLLKGKKRFYTLAEQLAQIPPSANFTQKNSLELLADREIEETQVLFGEAEKAEHEGDSKRALEKYIEIQQRVSDFPGLDEYISKAKHSVELVDTKNINSSNKESIATKSPVIKASKSKKTKEGLTFYEDDTERKMGLLPVVFGCALLAFGLILGFFYFSSSSKITKAEKKLTQCQQNIKNKKYKDADLLCIQALSDVKAVTIFKSSEKQLLIKAITKVLNSKKLKQGLTGNIFYKGKYISDKSFKSIKKYETHVETGKVEFDAEKWQSAFTNFEMALRLADKNKDIEIENLPEINALMSQASFNFSYDAGKRYAKEKSWDLAAKQLAVALNALGQLDEASIKQYQTEIQILLSEGKYHTLRNQADTLFELKKWQESVRDYYLLKEQAAIFLKNKPSYIKSINEQIAKATLYTIVESGKTSFTEGKWDEAIAKYDAAIALLNENKESLRQIGSKENRTKLSRIKLQASIIRDNQEAARNLKDREYNKAIKQLKSIIVSIDKSSFTKEEQFSNIKKEAQKSITKARSDKFIDDRIKYLEANFKKIFADNNSALTEEDLHDPKMTYVKKVGSSYVFKLQCTEKGRGRPLRLVMDYLYNPANQKWSFYTD